MARGRKPGPKPHVTAAVKARILDLLNLGLSLAEALTITATSHRTYCRARQADPEFARGIKRAALEGKEYHLRRVHDGVPSWQSSAWFLERKYGAEFGRRDRLDLRQVSDDEINSEVEKLARGGEARAAAAPSGNGHAQGPPSRPDPGAPPGGPLP